MVYKSGYATYDGKMNVPMIGHYEATCTKDQLKSLITLIREKKVEQLDTLYTNKYLADYPTWNVWVGDKLPSKKIFVNDTKVPTNLTEYSVSLEQFIKTLNWKESPQNK
jgi:hypothetical protein